MRRLLVPILACLVVACNDDGSSILITKASVEKVPDNATSQNLATPSPRPSPTPVRFPQPVTTAEPTSAVLSPLPTPAVFVGPTKAPPTPVVPTPRPSPSSPEIGPATFHLFAGTDADPTSSSSTASNYAMAPLIAPARKLMVFLPRLGGTPSEYTHFLRAGAARGYHALGLVYKNDVAAAKVCGGDLDCYGGAHGAWFGDANSPQFILAPQDGIANRVAKAMGYLQQQFPTEGWSQFLLGDAPRWSQVVLAGHGEGADEAAYVATREQLARVVLLSGAADGTASAAASWIKPGATPTDQVFAMAHVQDPQLLDGHITRAWTALGLDALGAAQRVGDGSAITGKHELLLDTYAPQEHWDQLPAMDVWTPETADNVPLLEGVWAQMLGP